MELLLEQKKEDENILIPAAILHDTGWSRVPTSLQKTSNKAKAKKAMELHLKYSIPIIREVLTKIGYNKKQIERIVSIVLSHKYKNPFSIRNQDKLPF